MTDSRDIRSVLVITGDHGLPDVTKWDGGYAPGDLELHAEMVAALESLPGYGIEVLSDHGRLLERLLEGERPALAVNFCDTGFGNVATQELHVPALLELLGIAYTGAPPACMTLCYDKAIVRLVAQAHGVAVPWEAYLAPDRPLDDLDELDAGGRFPALIKPATGDGSEGISRDAVVRSAGEARDHLRWFRDTLPGRAALIQEYLPGAEYGLALIGNPGLGFRALPPLMVDYGALEDGLPPILCFESKTGPESAYAAVRVVPARLDEEALAAMRRDAELLFARLGCRDYARFDFRTGADGTIKLLEVNPNPAWSSAGKLALMAGFAGKTYPQLLAMILDAASARLRTASAAP